MNIRAIHFLLLAVIGICAGCANITAPTGGKRDKTPPKLVSIDPADSLKNTRVKRIEMHFDEYITVSDVSKEVHISPLLSIDPTVIGLNKHVIVKIVDSLLDSNTTYRISFGNAIKDLHEGNPYSGHTYTFSTGAYFDSLQLQGSVINAATGLPDTGNVIVALYSAGEVDSAVVRHKPKYITNPDAKGNFVFKGLPHRHFRIYAIKDMNGNLIYDGPAGGEMIAFMNKTITPGDTTTEPVKLRMFAEIQDTATKKTMDSVAKKPRPGKSKESTTEALTYSVNIDTSNINKRLFDITHPISIVFSKPPVLKTDKIKLSYDSSGINVMPDVSISMDTLKNVLSINTMWSENRVYTLRLAKGFAKDTSGADVMPSRYSFRTFEDEDYGKIIVNFPAKYNDPHYLLQVIADKDTVYLQPITDITKTLTRLKPAKYTFCIIVDKNGNGKWDTGDLFGKIQPEEVIPYRDNLTLKAGWENIIDFEQKPVDKKGDAKDIQGKK